MANARHVLGLQAEQAVADWLAGKGWQILERRWRGPSGELDLVCRDARGVTVGVEVKLRSSARAGSGAESLSARQVARLRSSLAQYAAAMSRHGGIRLDLIEVMPAAGDQWRVRRHAGIGGW